MNDHKPDKWDLDPKDIATLRKFDYVWSKGSLIELMKHLEQGELVSAFREMSDALFFLPADIKDDFIDEEYRWNKIRIQVKKQTGLNIDFDDPRLISSEIFNSAEDVRKFLMDFVEKALKMLEKWKEYWDLEGDSDE